MNRNPEAPVLVDLPLGLAQVMRRLSTRSSSASTAGTSANAAACARCSARFPRSAYNVATLFFR